MVSEAFVTNAVTLVAVLILVGTFFLPKKVRYAVHGLILLLLGIIPILYQFNVVGFTFGEAGIWKYLIAVVVIFTARSLIMEGVKEESSFKWVSIIFGIIVVILVTIPALNKVEALTFTIPEYPAIIDHIIYVIAAILLFVGLFMSKSE
ncbi:hypothetical protein KY363_03720 [Candidatus Woesearchaeota archaeon]|nr:hypothetical protein [Candidatus Woesearchaeota archaeon]